MDDNPPRSSSKGRPPRTETTITDTNDFRDRERPTNWLPAALQEIRRDERRVLGVQRIGHDLITAGPIGVTTASALAASSLASHAYQTALDNLTRTTGLAA